AALHTASPAPATNVVQETEKPKESPLSFRIGGTDFTPGGFVDFENVFRTTNATSATGNPIATSFGGLPFNNTIQGHLTEFRSTGQYSRYNLKVSGKYGANNVVGYIEGDFNGNDAANVFVTANGHTNRLRLYWLDLKRGKWEFLGGSSWGLETPNRTGLSPMPADLALTLGEDANVHVGIPYTRAAEFRAVYHFSDHFQWGFALQNPDQFVNAGEVIFPFGFNAALGGQLDAANSTGTPNLGPDIHTKMAWDNDVNGKHYHFELGGLLTTVKTTNVPIGGTTFESHTSVGGGFLGAFNFELFKGFRVLANGLYGDGVGRYLIGLAPQTVVRPIATGPATFTIDNSLVHSGMALVGFEATAKKSQFGFYYGGMYAQRNAFPDVTSPIVLPPTALIACSGSNSPLQNKPCIGFGGTNSPNSANRAIQEASFDWTQTFWKNPQYGAVVLITQTSYLTRAPWFVPAGAPKNAHLVMGFVSMRYVLP
ncbi:MAG TPA: hypothetical protein VLA83_07810, partial [Candidatus Binatia bacterium]|nr:hypothetical protein [Candidatus Binatia bacterium]